MDELGIDLLRVTVVSGHVTASAAPLDQGKPCAILRRHRSNNGAVDTAALPLRLRRTGDFLPQAMFLDSSHSIASVTLLGRATASAVSLPTKDA